MRLATAKKAIDDYPAVAFQTTNYLVNSLEEFIEAVRPELSLYVQQRDMAESPENPVDMTGWLDQEIQIDSVELPTLQPQPIEGLADPEVKL